MAWVIAFDEANKRFKKVWVNVPVTKGEVTTDSSGVATIELPYAMASKPRVFLMPEGDNVVATIIQWIKNNNGKYTGFKIKTYRILNKINKSTLTVVTGINKSTGQGITSVSIGSDAGHWSKDSNNNLSHTHPVTTSKSTFVTNVTVNTNSVIHDVSVSLQVAPNTPVHYVVYTP